MSTGWRLENTGLLFSHHPGDQMSEIKVRPRLVFAGSRGHSVPLASPSPCSPGCLPSPGSITASLPQSVVTWTSPVCVPLGPLSLQKDTLAVGPAGCSMAFIQVPPVTALAKILRPIQGKITHSRGWNLNASWGHISTQDISCDEC